MKVDEIRELSDEEMTTRLGEVEDELFRLRIQHELGQLENPLRLRALKRDVARLKTIRRQRERGGQTEGAKG